MRLMQIALAMFILYGCSPPILRVTPPEVRDTLEVFVPNDSLTAGQVIGISSASRDSLLWFSVIFPPFLPPDLSGWDEESAKREKAEYLRKLDERNKQIEAFKKAAREQKPVAEVGAHPPPMDTPVREKDPTLWNSKKYWIPALAIGLIVAFLGLIYFKKF